VTDASGADTIIWSEASDMKTTYTDAGTPVIDMSDDEYHAFLDREVRARIGLSLDESVRRVNAGEIDWDHAEAFSLAGHVGVGDGSLIASGRNGHRQSA
jgi:hypothetical protein